jgi:putative ABC transport system permease protein
MLGGWQPARDAARDVPAQALKAGSGLDLAAARTRAWPTLAMLGGASLLLLVPPLFGLPLAAYVAIGLLLVAAILVKPLVAPPLLRPLARWWRNAPAPRWLAATRLAATPRFAAIGAAGIVASFALMVAMATMVTSFRASVDDWLERVLPADLYVRAAPVASGLAPSARFSAADLRRFAEHAAVARVETMRHQRLVLDRARPSVTLIAREFDRADPARTLPLTGARVAAPAGVPAVYVSEALVDLYGARPGTTLRLPIGGNDVDVFVAGVWRDYARQFGSVIMDVADYERITGDRSRTDASLWLRPGARASQVARELASGLDARSAEFAEPGEIRAVSLRIFDRSFAVTYLLELAAIVIGLTGIAATFAAQAIARTKEFGMLRHLGVTRREVLRLLAYEGLLITGLALVIGLAAGLAVAWVLVTIVNPQSFHWSMDLRLPGGLIATLIVALLAAAALTAVVAGRHAVSRSAVLAVREDW